jgi:hypothetical protein
MIHTVLRVANKSKKLLKTSTKTLPARPMWACLEQCPLREIASFELENSQSRKSVVKYFGSHTYFQIRKIKAKPSVRCKPGLLPEMWEKVSCEARPSE